MSEGSKRLRMFRVAALAAAAGLGLAYDIADAQGAEPRNIIVMISDGASFGAWDAADLQQYGSRASSPYFGSGFSKYLVTTYPLNTSSTPTGNSTPMVGYSPASAWGLGAYNTAGGYLRQNATDSAAAATALATGQKTYNNAMNWSNDNAPITPTLPELARQEGKVVGTITTVEWSHATPAAFSNAHDVSRSNYSAIAQDMLSGDVMDVIMGAGNPDFDDNGAAKSSGKNYNYVGGTTVWNSLNAGTYDGWASIQTKAQFEALASGDLSGLGGKTRVVGTAQVATTLQQVRGGYSATDTPGSDPLNSSVPTLATMTRAALNVLAAKDAGKGLFLQIEGGAIDWAAHANQTSRLVEEQVDFNNAVSEVMTWINANGGWDNNLLLITTDHGNAMPSGPDSGTVAHDRIEAGDLLNGQWTSGKPTGVRWWSGSHTNELVPLFARGAGSERLAALVDGTDASFATYYADWAAAGFDGRYIDNTDVFAVASAAVPEPAMLGLLGAGVLALRRRR